MEVGVLVGRDVGRTCDEEVDVLGRVVELQEVLGQDVNSAATVAGGLLECALHHVELHLERAPWLYRLLVRVDLRLNRLGEPLRRSLQDVRERAMKEQPVAAPRGHGLVDGIQQFRKTAELISGIPIVETFRRSRRELTLPLVLLTLDSIFAKYSSRRFAWNRRSSCAR